MFNLIVPKVDVSVLLCTSKPEIENVVLEGPLIKIIHFVLFI